VSGELAGIMPVITLGDVWG